MSVPESKRQENKLQVLLDAQSLTSYTLRICKNPKVFNPEFQHLLTEKITNTSIDIFVDLWTANNILMKPGTENFTKNRKDRKELQQKAAHNCNNMLALIQIAKPIFHLTGKRVRFWGKNIIKVRNLIRAWEESDNKRYKDV